MTEFMRAECGIRQLHARYIDAVWRQDPEALAGCFAESGEWKIAGMHLRGRREIREAVARLLEPCERVLMTVGIPLIELRERSSIGRVHCLEFAKLKSGNSAVNIGIYFDRYVEHAGTWGFQWRHWALQYRGPADLSAAFMPSPDYGPFPSMPGPDEPTVARRG